MQLFVKFMMLSLCIVLFACKKQEKYYSKEEGMRMADSLAQIELQKKIPEMEANFEYRKKVEIPFEIEKAGANTNNGQNLSSVDNSKQEDTAAVNKKQLTTIPAQDSKQ